MRVSCFCPHAGTAGRRVRGIRALAYPACQTDEEQTQTAPAAVKTVGRLFKIGYASFRPRVARE